MDRETPSGARRGRRRVKRNSHLPVIHVWMYLHTLDTYLTVELDTNPGQVRTGGPDGARAWTEMRTIITHSTNHILKVQITGASFLSQVASLCTRITTVSRNDIFTIIATKLISIFERRWECRGTRCFTALVSGEMSTCISTDVCCELVLGAKIYGNLMTFWFQTTLFEWPSRVIKLFIVCA